jgi:hypothetical protein
MVNAIAVIGNILFHGTAFGFESREREKKKREYEGRPMFE